MGCGVKNIRITRKFAIEDSKEIQGVIGGVVSHCAVEAQEADAFLEIAVGDLVDGFFQQGESFSAVAGLRQRHGALRILLRLRRGRGSFGRSLSP